MVFFPSTVHYELSLSLFVWGLGLATGFQYAKNHTNFFQIKMQPTSRVGGFEAVNNAVEPTDVFCGLASLIVEGRMPRKDGRGYGEGPHVPQNKALISSRHDCSDENYMVIFQIFSIMQLVICVSRRSRWGRVMTEFAGLVLNLALKCEISKKFLASTKVFSFSFSPLFSRCFTADTEIDRDELNFLRVTKIVSPL